MKNLNKLFILFSFAFLYACTDYVAEIDDQIEEMESSLNLGNDDESSSSSEVGVSCSSSKTSVGSSSSVKSSSSQVSSAVERSSSSSGFLFNSKVSYGKFVDPRDKQSYATVVLGKQLWMAENLNFQDTICVPKLKTYSGCYDNDSKNCKLYGRLYTASAAYETCTDSSTSTNQGLCPDHWHIPTKSEWAKMVEYVASVVGDDKVANSLKSLDGWSLNEKGSLGTDDFGFRILPAGIKNEFGKSEDLGQRGAFWTSYFMTGSAETYEMLVAVEYGSHEEIVQFGDHGRNYSYFLSIRCISDSLVCGSTIYDVNKDFCYEESLYPLCKGNNYNPDVYTCVDDSIVKIGSLLSSSSKVKSSSSAEPESSSSKAKSSSSTEPESSSSEPESSSSSEIVSSSSKTLEMCGTKEYDPKIKFCHENSIYNLCNNKTYNPSKYVCAGTTLLPLCGTETFDESKEFCSGDVVYPLCGNESYDVEEEFCYDRVVYSKGGGETYDPVSNVCVAGVLKDLCGNVTYVPSDSKKCEDGVLYDLFTDPRDGLKYRFVTIDTFTVMADNLNYSDSSETPNMLERSSCYDEKEENCEKFGRLYTWTATMNLANSYVVDKYNASDKHQGLCPVGWHIPNMTEWQDLYSYVQKKNKNTPYDELKTQTGWKTAGSNLYGFSAKPGGFYSMSVGRYYEVNESVAFWSVSEYSGNSAYYFKISNTAISSDLMSKWQRYYIRCFRN